MKGPKHRAVPHSLVDPELVADVAVQADHDQQRQEEEAEQDEGGVASLLRRAGPLLQAADVLLLVQEVVLDLQRKNESVSRARRGRRAADGDCGGAAWLGPWRVGLLLGACRAECSSAVQCGSPAPRAA